MQGIGKRPRKKRASPPTYVSPNQLTIEGFEAPIEQGLDKENRWVKEVGKIFVLSNLPNSF